MLAAPQLASGAQFRCIMGVFSFGKSFLIITSRHFLLPRQGDGVTYKQEVKRQDTGKELTNFKVCLVVGLPLVPTIPCCNSRRFVDQKLTLPLPARSRPPQVVRPSGVVLQTSGFGGGGSGTFRPQQMLARRNRKRRCKQPKTRRRGAELPVRFCSAGPQNAPRRQRDGVTGVQPIRSCRAAVSS